MDVRRLRFAAALAAFVLWVSTLGVMVSLSSRKPPERSKPPAESPPASASGAAR